MFDWVDYLSNLLEDTNFVISKIGSEIRSIQNDIDNLSLKATLIILIFVVIDVTALITILRQHNKGYERITLKNRIIPLFVAVPLFYIGYIFYEGPNIEKYYIPPNNYTMMNITKDYLVKRDKALDEILHRISFLKGNGYHILQKGDLLIGGNITLFITPPISNPVIVGILFAVQGFLLAFFICQGVGILIEWYRHKYK
jgi:hypothetical protein